MPASIHPPTLHIDVAPDGIRVVYREIKGIIGADHAAAIYPIWAGYWFELHGGRDEGDKGLIRDHAFAVEVGGHWHAAYDAAAVTGTERGRIALAELARDLVDAHQEAAPELLSVVGELILALEMADAQRRLAAERHNVPLDGTTTPAG
jgi:hypothetical protein